MRADTQVLWNQTAASRTRLGGMIGRYFDDLDTSVCRFVVQHHQKSRPASIMDTLGQIRLRQALDVQVLNRDPSKAIDELAREFVQKVTPLIRNVDVRLGDPLHRFAPAARGLLAPRDAALLNPQFPLGAAEMSRRFDRLAVVQSNQM